MAGQDIAACTDQRVCGFRLADWQGPVAGEDHLQGGIRVHRARAPEDRVDVAQHARNGLCRHEADLVRLGGEACRDAIHVMRLIEIAEIAAGVIRVLALLPERGGMAERDLGIFPCHIHHEGVEVAEGGREDQFAPSRLIMDSMDFATAAVSGTFSSSMIFTPGVALSTPIETAWAWFQPKSSLGPT